MGGRRMPLKSWNIIIDCLSYRVIPYILLKPLFLFKKMECITCLNFCGLCTKSILQSLKKGQSAILKAENVSMVWTGYAARTQM